MKRYIEFVLRHRSWFLSAILVITVAGIFSMSRAVIHTSVEKLFFGDSPKYERYQDFINEFTNDLSVVIGIEDKELLAQEGLGRLERAISQVGGLNHVEHIDSLLNAQRIRGEGDSLEVEEYAALLRQSSTAQDRIIDQILEDPIHEGLLISNDVEATIVLIELSVDITQHGAEELPRVVKKILNCFRAEGFLPEQLYPGGFIVAVSEMFDQTYYTLSRITPAVLIILLLVVYVLFGNIWPVLIVGAITLLSCIWTMGFAVLLDREINVFMAMAPSVIIVVAFSDVIHLSSTYRMLISQGIEKQEAIVESCSEVGLACIYTSLTTFMSFIAMSFVPVPALRQYSIALGFGVGIALLLAITVTPILFQSTPPPKVPTRMRAGNLILLDKLIVWAHKLSFHRPWSIISIFGVLTAVSIYGVVNMNIDQNLVEKFDHDSPVRIAEGFLKKNFRGTNAFDIIIDTGEPDKLKQPLVLSRIAAYQEELKSFSEVDKILSYVDLMQILHQEMGPTGFSEDPLPPSRDLIAQYLLLFEMSGGEGIEKLINSDFSRMRMMVRLNHDDWRQTAYFAQIASRESGKFFDSTIRVEPTGMMYLIGEFVDTIIVGQRRGLLFALLIITATMTIILRSIRNGLAAIVPNLFPLLALGGYLSLSYDKVQTDALFIALIAIGIGVDDTIHFLTRLKIESNRCEDVGAAVVKTLSVSGRGIVMTTIILSLGFLPFCTSGYYLTKMYGTLLPLTLILALTADILLVPALVKVGMIRFGESR